MKYLIGFISGFTGSALLYQPTHTKSFPELGRYTAGVILIGLSYRLAGGDSQDLEKLLPSAIGAGCGVALARIMLR